MNLQNIAAISALSGLKALPSSSFSTSIASQTLGAGQFVSALASTALSNTNSISQVQVNYAGINSNNYIFYGDASNDFDSGNYQVESFYYFDAINLNVLTIVSNQTGGNYTIPAITVNCRGFLYLAPF